MLFDCLAFKISIRKLVELKLNDINDISKKIK